MNIEQELRNKGFVYIGWINIPSVRELVMKADDWKEEYSNGSGYSIFSSEKLKQYYDKDSS